MSRQLWYVAYGSNTATRYFTSRFEGADVPPGDLWTRETWTWLPYELYFAGFSRTWNGSAVAFVSLNRSEGARTAGRAYLVDEDRLDVVLAAEHLSIPNTWAYDIGLLPQGSWCPLPTPAKYNALLRVEDVEGLPAYTITTARRFKARSPSDAYLATCREGLAEEVGPDELDAYLEAAARRSTPEYLASMFPPQAAASLVWRKTLPLGSSTGYPSVQLARAERWLRVEAPMPARVSHDGRHASVWLLPAHDQRQEFASTQVFRALGLEPDYGSGEHVIECSIEAPYPVELQRRPALSDDVEIADHVHVASTCAERLGPWAVLVTPSLSGPVRLCPRASIPEHTVRVSYATREIWEIESPTGSARLIPILEPGSGESSRSGRLRRVLPRLWRNILERWLGAPVVPLRATEAVIGDEGRTVARIDATALDFLGIGTGDEVIVSWADRETTARALLQTPELRERMRDQLGETTGKQSRLSTAPALTEKELLWHMQAWLSPSVRQALSIPPNTVVRVRRNVTKLLAKNLVALPLPVGGLLIAGFAVPGVSPFVWVGVGVLVVLLAFVPLRVRT